MGRYVHRLVLNLLFPAGLSPGDGKQGNVQVLAKDGRGRPLLRGTALAGTLRHAYARKKQLRHGDPGVASFFGQALEDEMGGTDSPLRIADALINLGTLQDGWERHHNSIDRHTGAVLNKSLFTVQALPPGSRATTVLWFADSDDDDEAADFFRDLVALFDSGLILGGNSARGLGRVALEGANYRRFDCSIIDEHAAWLDEDHAWRRCGEAPTTGIALEPNATDGESLSVTLRLAVPRSQDLLIGPNEELDHQIDPQQVTHTDGSQRWLLPGSSLKGVLRSWMTRLAARAGEPVADSIDAFDANPVRDGNQLAWGFDNDGARKAKQKRLADDPSSLDEQVPCPIMRLFGSSYSRGRLHVSDGLSTAPVHQSQWQRRAHVAVDRLTGGANEGFFFDAAVLTSPMEFETVITIQRPERAEVERLVASIRALDLGVLRVGSSKAGGCLSLAAPPKAVGPHQDLIAAVQPGGEYG